MGKTGKHICSYDGCKKKISIVDLLSSKCKCEKAFCLKHRLPEQHNCQYDHKYVDKNKEIEKLRCVSEYDKI